MVAPGDPIDPNPVLPPYSGQPYPGQPYPGQPYPGPYPTPYPTPYAGPYPASAPGGYPGGYYGGGYPYPYARPPRPGEVTASAVLGYVTSGLLVMLSLWLFVAASLIRDVDSLDGGTHRILAGELTVDGVLNVAAAALLVIGGVSFSGGSAKGRVVLSVGAGIALGECVYWLARTGPGATAIAPLLGALAILVIVLAWLPPATRWLQRSGPT